MTQTPLPERDDNPDSLLRRLRYYLLTPVDGRYEDLRKGRWQLNVLRDLSAGVVVAMIAIPLAMGFAMASGLRPEQGIVGGAIAALVGALFGGSKYQVYGPTAAFIPIIAGAMALYDFGFLIAASLIAGVILAGLGLARLGRVIARVPHSIVVGFTIGIAVVIALSQVGEALGLREKLGYDLVEKIQGIIGQIGDVNIAALAVTAGTFIITKYGLKISPYIPAPLLALGLGGAATTWLIPDAGLRTIADEYGSIPTDFWVLTLPELPAIDLRVVWDLGYLAVAIVFVSGIESLLCSRMADRLAENEGRPFDPDKELWGQGMVQVIVPLLNGFPHTGALARTATNIRLGARSPLAGVFKCFIKLALAAWLASWLEQVPMACVAGVLIYVAHGMVHPKEVAEVNRSFPLDRWAMIYTAVMVPATDFLTGVLSALVLYALAKRFGIGVRKTKS
jgi:MFS superfamily sulfate permease-like transporter